MGFFLGIIIFAADVWAVARTIQSPATPGIKTLWVVFIFLLPVLGLLLWLFLGPKPLQA